MRYVRLLAVFAATELQFAVEYRANLLLDLFEEVVIVVTSLLAVLVLFSHTGVINGWTLAQMIVLLGVYYVTARFWRALVDELRKGVGAEERLRHQL